MSDDLKKNNFEDAQEPYVEIDGGFLRCPNCWTEIKPNYIGSPRCNKCGQPFNWINFDIKGSDNNARC